MRVLSNNKAANVLLLSAMGLIVICMLSSFVTRMVIAPPVDSNIDNGIQKSTVSEVIQINVLNASGKKGLASKVKDFLRSRGFDVVEVGNYDQMTDKSQVIDRLGDMKSARKVAYALGISDSMVTGKLDSNMYLRASVVIGNDFSELKPFK